MKRLSKKELSDIYYNNTNKKACEILGISEVTLHRYCDKVGIARKGQGGGMTTRNNGHIKYEITE